MRVTFVCILLLAGCGTQPPKPDPVAPLAVVKAEPVRVAVAAPREVPAELTAPLRVDMPEFVDLAQPHDYGITREQHLRFLRLLSAFERYHQLCSGFAAQ